LQKVALWELFTENGPAQRPLPERNTALVAGVFSSPDDQDELDLEKEQQVIARQRPKINLPTI